MSATTKKKYVTKEVLEEYPLPNGERQVVKVTASRGNNLHEVMTSSDETFLVSMPSKFRKHVWIKRGDFIMVESIQEGDKVKGEITHILFKDQIKYIQDQKLWPEKFSNKVSEQDNSMVPDDMMPPSDSEGSDNNLGDLVVNMNRAHIAYVPSESEEESSEEEEEDYEANEGSSHCSGDDSRTSLSEKDSSSLICQNDSSSKKEKESTLRDAG